LDSLLPQELTEVCKGNRVMIQNSEVFNISEAAGFLGAHEQTVRRPARRGGIPAFKVGKGWRFRKQAILRWSEEDPELPVVILTGYQHSELIESATQYAPVMLLAKPVDAALLERNVPGRQWGEE
jgi:excisionase family DNA binding protein